MTDELGRTYGELTARVARVAGGLRSNGLAEGGIVAILTDNGEPHLECTYAVPWAGGVLNPPNTRLGVAEIGRLLDDSAPNGHDVVPGVSGEIVVKGDNVMLGYWRNPRATAEVVRDGWLHTGDIGRMDADGYVYIVDRLKDMIVSGGENIASLEVEHAITDHPFAAACAVTVLPDQRLGERIHAVVVLRPGRDLTVGEIQQHVRPLLGALKVPRSIEFCDELPVSAAGKVVKRELRARGEVRR